MTTVLPVAVAVRPGPGPGRNTPWGRCSTRGRGPPACWTPPRWSATPGRRCPPSTARPTWPTGRWPASAWRLPDADRLRGRDGRRPAGEVLFLDETAAGDYAAYPARALDVVRGRSPPSMCWPPQRSWWSSPRSASPHPSRRPGGTSTGRCGSTRRWSPWSGWAPPVPPTSATSTTYSRRGPTARANPGLADAAAQVLHAVLGDRMVEDLPRRGGWAGCWPRSRAPVRRTCCGPQRCPVPTHRGDRRQPTARGVGHPCRAGVRRAHRRPGRPPRTTWLLGRPSVAAGTPSDAGNS